MTSPRGPSQDLRLQFWGAPSWPREGAKTALWSLIQAETSVDNTLTTEGDRQSVCPLENTSDGAIRRKHCSLRWGGKSTFWGAAELHRHSIADAEGSVFSSAVQAMSEAFTLVTAHSHWLPTHSTTSAAGSPGLAFQNPTGAERVGDHSASRSGECYQIQMSGTRRKWSPPARKQLGWAQNMHRNQNGHKRWEAPQVESIIVAETEIRKGTYTVRHSLLGKDIPKQKQDESHAFLSTTGSHIHYWKYSWKYLSRGITTRNLFFF